MTRIRQVFEFIAYKCNDKEDLKDFMNLLNITVEACEIKINKV